MKKEYSNRRRALILVIMLTAFVGSAESRPSPGPSPSVTIPGHDMPKSKPSKAKPKPIRAALEARYAESRDAYLRKTPEPLIRMRTSDTFSVTPSGEVWDAATVSRYILAAFAQVETTLVLTFDIETIEVKGDTAAAAIDQHWVRRQQKAGAPRIVDTRAHQRETWVLRDGAWLLWRVDEVVPGAWIVDGKRIDPSKPYDPKAPAYIPADGSP